MYHTNKTKKHYNNKKTKSSMNDKRIMAIAKKAAFKNVEQRYYDFSTVTGYNNISTTWSEGLVSSIAQGTGLASRTGDKIEINGFYYEGMLENSYGSLFAADDYNVVRFVIGLYEVGNGTPLATAGITMNQPIRKDMCNTLIRKIYDRYHVLVPNGVVYNGTSVLNGIQVRQIRLNYTFKKPIVVRYTGAAGTSGCTGLYLGFLSDSTLTPHPGIVNGYYTLRYKDC